MLASSGQQNRVVIRDLSLNPMSWNPEFTVIHFEGLLRNLQCAHVWSIGHVQGWSKSSATRYLIAESCEPIGISLQEKDCLIRILNYLLQSSFHSILMNIVHNITPWTKMVGLYSTMEKKVIFRVDLLNLFRI